MLYFNGIAPLGIRPRKTGKKIEPEISSNFGPMGKPKYSMSLAAKSIHNYAHEELDDSWGCYHVEWPSGYSEYLLWQMVDGKIVPMYHSQVAEELWVKIEVIALAINFETKNYEF